LTRVKDVSGPTGESLLQAVQERLVALLAAAQRDESQFPLGQQRRQHVEQQVQALLHS